MTHVKIVSLLVKDYDEAIQFYAQKLGFEVVEDAGSATAGGSRSPCRTTDVRSPSSWRRRLMTSRSWAGRLAASRCLRWTRPIALVITRC